MKKFLTLRNIVLASGALLVVVGFILAYVASFNIELMGYPAEVKGFVFGGSAVVVEGQEYTVKDLLGAQPGILVAPFLGGLFMVLGAIGACVVGLFVKKPFAKFIVLGCAVLVLAGGIMQFFPVESFSASYSRAYAKEAGITDEAEIQQLINQMTESLKQLGAKAPLSIVGGVLGCVGAVATGVSAFLGKKGE